MTAAARPSIAPTTALRLVGLLLALAALRCRLRSASPLRSIGQDGGSARRPRCCFSGCMCAGLGVKVRRHGSIDRARKQLIVVNHVSWLDIPVLGSLAPMSFLAKKEIGHHVVGRELVALQGAVYVDRRRRSCIPRVNAAMAETIRSGAPVVLFAEATTGRRESSSAFSLLALRGRPDRLSGR